MCRAEVSAFVGADLKALGISDTRDLGNLVPGFTTATRWL